LKNEDGLISESNNFGTWSFKWKVP